MKGCMWDHASPSTVLLLEHSKKTLSESEQSNRDGCEPAVPPAELNAGHEGSDAISLERTEHYLFAM